MAVGQKQGQVLYFQAEPEGCFIKMPFLKYKRKEELYGKNSGNRLNAICTRQGGTRLCRGQRVFPMPKNAIPRSAKNGSPKLNMVFRVGEPNSNCQALPGSWSFLTGVSPRELVSCCLPILADGAIFILLLCVVAIAFIEQLVNTNSHDIYLLVLCTLQHILH